MAADRRMQRRKKRRARIPLDASHAPRDARIDSTGAQWTSLASPSIATARVPSTRLTRRTHAPRGRPRTVLYFLDSTRTRAST